jgi:hypothetical protein
MEDGMRRPRTGDRTTAKASAVGVRLLLYQLSLSSFLLFAGCGGAIHHDSFSEFSHSMHELRDGADQALELPYLWGRERYIAETATASIDTTAGLAAVQRLILERDEDDVFDWAMADEPLHVKQIRFRRGVYELNDGLVDYADLLGDLANAGLTTAQFDDRATQMNAGLRGLATSMGDPTSGQGIALFSTAATELIRVFIDNGKREHLRRAIEANQENIESASTQMQEALHLSALHLWQEYDEIVATLIEPIHPFSKTKLKDRKKSVGGIVEANEILMYQLNALEVLVESYRALPRANQELVDSLDTPGWSLNAIYEIAENGLRLRRLYDEFGRD